MKKLRVLLGGDDSIRNRRSVVATVAQRLSRTRFGDQDFRSMDLLEHYRHHLCTSITLHART